MPSEIESYDYARIKEIVQCRKVEVSTDGDIIVYNLFYDNMLNKKGIISYICQRMNNLAIFQEEKILYFQVKES